MWSPQQYISQGKAKGVSEEILDPSVEQINAVLNDGLDLPSILSLNHLAVRTKIPYLSLKENCRA